MVLNKEHLPGYRVIIGRYTLGVWGLGVVAIFAVGAVAPSIITILTGLLVGVLAAFVGGHFDKERYLSRTPKPHYWDEVPDDELFDHLDKYLAKR